jgi:hypothetical protein
MFEAEFLTMMPHEVSLQLLVGYTSTMEPIYETDEDDQPVIRRYRARVTGKSLSLRQPTEEEVTPIFDIYLGARLLDDGSWRPVGDDPIEEGAKLILPDDPAWAHGTVVIFAVGRNTDEDGHHHVKIQLGWRYHRQGQ